MAINHIYSKIWQQINKAGTPFVKLRKGVAATNIEYKIESYTYFLAHIFHQNHHDVIIYSIASK